MDNSNVIFPVFFLQNSNQATASFNGEDGNFELCEDDTTTLIELDDPELLDLIQHSNNESIHERNVPMHDMSDETYYSESSEEDHNLQTGNESFDLTIGRVQKPRKKIGNPSEWQDIKNRTQRECGEAYQGWIKPKNGQGQRGAERAARSMGLSCNSNQCRKMRGCLQIKEEERQIMFNFFWKKMSWDQKKVYVTSLVNNSAPKRRTADSTSSRRQMTLFYRLKVPTGMELKVCKRMFLSTLGLNEWMVRNWVNQSESGMYASTKERYFQRKEHHEPEQATSKEFLIQFLDKLAKLPSHYRRKNCSKNYLEPTFLNSMSELYREYKKLCESANPPQKHLSRFTFDLVIKEKNIGFQPPKQDRCDLCISYEAGNTEKEEYDTHRRNKEIAQIEKANDKTNAEQGNVIALTMDLQAVKICPSLNASALYYKTKLCVHNFTVFDLNTHHSRCYWFDETEADLTANTFASLLIDYLKNTVSQLNNRSKDVIIWSDGCTYQNRNATVSNALLSFSVTNKITIYQKYLAKGHTQMEVDSVHAAIERKTKNKPIYLPLDYIRLTSEARLKPEPYETKRIDFDFCRNYSSHVVYPSIRPGKIAGDPQVTDIKVIKYSPDGVISVKTRFDAEFLDLPQKRGTRLAVISIDSFPQLHPQKIPIKKQKWLHLQELKKVIPKDCHAFYDNLPHL